MVSRPELTSLNINFTAARQCRFLHMVSTVAYLIMVAYQCLLPLPSSSLIFSPTKQPYSKVGNSRIYQYGNADRNYKIWSGVINFSSQRNFKQTFMWEFLLRKSNACFLWRFEYRRRRLNSNYPIGWSNRNYDGRIQRHFPCWRWCSSVRGRTNANIPQYLFGAIPLVRTYLMTNFSTSLPLYAPLHILDNPLCSPSCLRT